MNLPPDLINKMVANGGKITEHAVRVPGQRPIRDSGVLRPSIGTTVAYAKLQGPCQSLWIPNWFPTLMNKLTTSGGHWSTTGRRKKADRNIIAAYSVCTAKAEGPRKVSIMLVLPKGKRLPDEDSLEKSVWDSLVHCGRLINDTPKWCRRGFIGYTRALLDCPIGTLILLEELC